jgi:hypothetical protein
MKKIKRDYLGLGNFVWWIGIVESIKDPLKTGRVRVRCFEWHSKDKNVLPTDDLPWAQVLMPVTSTSNSGVGNSPTGLINGSWVMGFFLDGEDGQRPMVMGTIPGIPSTPPNSELGFNDPDGVYPSLTEEPDTNRLARNDIDIPHKILQEKESRRIKGIPIAQTQAKYDEPSSEFFSTYPDNQVFETKAGHIKEYDNTPGAERIHEYHKSGTFTEVNSLGNKHTRVVGKNYEIIANTNHVYVKGNCFLTIDESCFTRIKGDWNIEVDGNKNETVKGNVIEKYGKNHNATVAQFYDLEATRIDFNKSQGGGGGLFGGSFFGRMFGNMVMSMGIDLIGGAILDGIGNLAGEAMTGLESLGTAGSQLGTGGTGRTFLGEIGDISTQATGGFGDHLLPGGGKFMDSVAFNPSRTVFGPENFQSFGDSFSKLSKVISPTSIGLPSFNDLAQGISQGAEAFSILTPGFNPADTTSAIPNLFDIELIKPELNRAYNMRNVIQNPIKSILEPNGSNIVNSLAKETVGALTEGAKEVILYGGNIQDVATKAAFSVGGDMAKQFIDFNDFKLNLETNNEIIDKIGDSGAKFLSGEMDKIFSGDPRNYFKNASLNQVKERLITTGLSAVGDSFTTSANTAIPAIFNVNGLFKSLTDKDASFQNLDLVDQISTVFDTRELASLAANTSIGIQIKESGLLTDSAMLETIDQIAKNNIIDKVLAGDKQGLLQVGLSEATRQSAELIRNKEFAIDNPNGTTSDGQPWFVRDKVAANTTPTEAATSNIDQVTDYFNLASS